MITYPNPVQSDHLFAVVLSAPVSDVDIKMYNIRGQLVRSLQRQTSGRESTILLDTNGLASGIYIISLDGRGWQVARKINVLR